MRLIAVFFLMIISLSSSAQNETEAKAAYLLAEESYGKGDYKGAMSYLDEAKKNMGAINNKMLYLQIQIQLELFKTDQSYYDKILNSISQFETAPEYKNFNEEKVLEVTKIKLQLKNQKKRAEQEAAESAKRIIDGRKAFEEFNINNWPVNLSFTALQEKYKSDSLFLGGVKSVKDEKYKAILHHAARIKFWRFPEYRHPVIGAFFVNKPGIYGVFTKNEIVKGYASVLMLRDLRDTRKNGATYEVASKEFQNLIEMYSQLFAAKPKVNSLPANKYYQFEEYVWESADKKVTIEHEYGQGSKDVSWTVIARMYLTYN